jgi:AraC-like DNA-binding protein
MRLDDDTRRRLCRARDALEVAADDALSVRDLARRTGISPFHFIRVFEATFGVTPHQCRIAARLDRAKHLLASGHAVTDVCMEVGFSSVGSFSALFTRRIGQSPSAYRRRLRVLAQVPAELRRVLAPGCFTLMGSLPPDAFRTFREA